MLALALGAGLAFTAPAPVMAFGAPDTFADLAEKISPSVVNITTSSMVSRPSDGGPVAPEGSPLEDFFKDFGGQGDQGPQRSEALGSGFVISEDGYIVTNDHVIKGADEITIEFFSGEKLPAKLVGTDPQTDIALLKVETDKPLPFVSFGNSDLARVGDWVVAMGNPLGQGFSVSAGIVSARNRELSGTYDDYLQTDAAINRGNSGGPLFNMDGQVIGVNTAILSPTGGSIGIGFSMSSNVVTKVVDQLKQFGETRRGWLGVRIQDVTPDIAEAMGLAAASGALVTDVPDGPAKDAGMLAGDVIQLFNGQEVRNAGDLTRRVADAPVGEAVPVVVLREGGSETLNVTLGRREEAEPKTYPASADQEEAPQAQLDILGMQLDLVTDALRDQLGIPASTEGLIVAGIDQASEAWTKGLREGDVITEVSQQKIVRAQDLKDRIEDAKKAGRKSVLLRYSRGGDLRFVALLIQ
ncbi:Do family serine endopeptidase [Pseudogemmobacter bohemicus]|uniref:Do family serine endopeptidase n=1 Tax=Pseudogemmobacter bohemicus TaxID=2250708 RepID=UPI000DD42A62